MSRKFRGYKLIGHRLLRLFGEGDDLKWSCPPHHVKLYRDDLHRGGIGIVFEGDDRIIRRHLQVKAAGALGEVELFQQDRCDLAGSQGVVHGSILPLLAINLGFLVTLASVLAGKSG